MRKDGVRQREQDHTYTAGKLGTVMTKDALLGGGGVNGTVGQGVKDVEQQPDQNCR